MGRYLLTLRNTFPTFFEILIFRKKKRWKNHFFFHCFFCTKKTTFSGYGTMYVVENHVRALLGPTSVPGEREKRWWRLETGEQSFNECDEIIWNPHKTHGNIFKSRFQTCFSKTSQKVVQKFHKSDGWTWKWKNSRWTDSVLDFKSQFHRPRHPTIQPSQAKWLILKICVWHAGHIWHGVKGIVCAVWPQMLSGGTKFCGCHQSLAKRGAQFRLTWSTWWNSDSKRCPSCFF